MLFDIRVAKFLKIDTNRTQGSNEFYFFVNKGNITKSELETLKGMEYDYYEIYGEHLITNYQELEKITNVENY